MPNTLSGLTFSFTEPEARDFSRALGRGDDAALPAGIAMKILFTPKVVTWIKHLVGAMTPIHMEQSYGYHLPLVPNVAYQVNITCDAMGTDKWEVTTQLLTPQDKLALKMTSLFLAHQAKSEA